MTVLDKAEASQMQSLSPPAALALLCKEFRTPQSSAEETQFKGLLEELGCFPPAIYLCAAFLRTGRSLNDFLQEHWRRPPSLAEEVPGNSTTEAAQARSSPSTSAAQVPEGIRRSLYLTLDLFETGDATLQGPFAGWRECLAAIRPRLGDPELRSIALWCESYLAERDGDLSSALQRTEELVTLCESLEDLRERAMAYGRMADLMQALDGSADALSVRKQKELPIYEHLGDRRAQLVTLRQIGALLARQGDVLEALRTYRFIGSVLESLGDLREQAETLERVVELLKEAGDELSIAKALQNLAEVLLRQTDHGLRLRAAELVSQANEIYLVLGIARPDSLKSLADRLELHPSPLLPITKLQVTDFRSIQHLEIQLDPRLTVLFGINACGKTTVLDALAFGFFPAVQLLDTTASQLVLKNPLRIVWQTDRGRRTAHPAPCARVEIWSADNYGNWAVTHRTGKPYRLIDVQRDAQGFAESAFLFDRLMGIMDQIRAGSGTWARLPLVAYYGVDRAIIDPGRAGRHYEDRLSRFDAYAGALEAGSRFSVAFDWFRSLDDRERRQREALGDPEYYLPELQAIRLVIETILPNCRRPRVLLDPTRFCIDFVRSDGGIEMLDVAQLSDGYRTHLALVLDLARRMIIANPPPPDDDPDSFFDWGPRAPALVLIDEVDLHLHPRWQQLVLSGLLRAFPRAQFVVTTHSEQVLASVPAEHQVLELRSTADGLAVGPPKVPVHGALSDQVLEVAMGIDARPPGEYRDRLKRYLDLVEQGLEESTDAQQDRSWLNGIRPDDPDLLRTDLLIRRRRMVKGKSEPKAPERS